MAKSTVLFVLTSHDTLGESGEKTGFHYEEMSTPYFVFTDEGYDVTISSIQGGKPPHDPGSVKEDVDRNPDSVCRFMGDEEAKKKLINSHPVSDVSPDRYDAVYLSGGHGTMWDFPDNTDLQEILARMDETGKIIGAVCHGPAGLVNVTSRKTGEPLVKDRRVNSFTDEEERAVEKDDIVPFLLESALKKRGAKFCSEPKFQGCVAIDHNLVTGQNPASCKQLAEEMIRLLKESSGHKAA